MKKKLLAVFFGIFLAHNLSFSQYIEGSPWMENLRATPSKSANSNPEIKYSLPEISEAFHAYWKKKDWKKKGSGFKPYMRWENYWMHQVDENGYLPSASKVLESWRKKQFASSMVPNPTSSWTAIGPFRPGELSGALPGTGRVNAIAVDPNNANIWYAGAPAGGIWKSTDAGANWTNLFDDFLQIGVSGIAIDPNDSNVIYIATGDDDAADSFSVGVFKSIDAGDTWQETSLGPTSISSWTNNRLMSEITIDPTNSNIIWVSTSFGLYKSIDAGASWDRKQTGNIKDFRLKPGDPNTVYAITNSAYFRSTDGENFTEITDILPNASGRRVLDVTPADPDVLYILTADTQANDYVYQGLYKSTNSGLTFTESPNTVNIMESEQAWFDLALAVSPTNSDELYMGCLNIWKSSNGGDSFSRVNQWNRNTAAYTHADIHTLKFFNDVLYACTDGGLYTSSNGGDSFTDVTENMAVTQFYRMTIANGNAQRLAGGTQDNSGFVGNGTEWNVYTGGDGMDYEIDPNNQDVIYGFVQFGDPLFITTTAGESVGRVNAPPGEQGNWITPLAVSADGEVFAGYDSKIYRLGNGAWEEWSNEFGGGNIDDIETDPNDPLVLYAAEGDFVYRSGDGGQNFTSFNRFDGLVSDIAIDQDDGSAIYVTTSLRAGISQANQTSGSAGVRGVFKVPVNPDGSAGPEEDLTLNLDPDQAFLSVMHQGRHTENPIFVGTNLGVYRLDDSLTEWEEYFTNLPSVAVSDLEISLDDEVIVASTYGRGAWISPIPVQQPDDDIRLVEITPFNGEVTCGEVFPAVVVENKGVNPITEVEVTYNFNSGGNEVLTWTGTIASNATQSIPLPSISNSTFGENTIEIEVSITNDAFNDNNTGTTTYIGNVFGIGDTVFDFETENSTLFTTNETDNGSVWERGVPTGTLLNAASSGTQVLGTNLDGNHPDAVKGFIYSGCYELSSIVAPVLKFNMAYDLEVNYDIVYVEYSLNDGANWTVLGQLGSQPNWYNSDRTNASSGGTDCENCPGAQWNGTNATLTEYAYDFVLNASLGETDLTNEDNVVFRIVFHSDQSVNEEGVIIDDFVVEGVQDDDDDDNDGVLDVDDNCPLIGNANQADNDGDGEGDVCDPDDDNDGILDVDDNCPFTANAGQEDTDGDGIGDVCDNDADNDGVPNNLDLCPDTPENTPVDVDGCPIFSLPANNFTIRTIGESCISSNNGQIEITAMSSQDYVAVIRDADSNEQSLSFTDSVVFENLVSGSYSVCITITGQADFEQCFDVLITEPQALGVASKIDNLKNEITLSLSGGTQYLIVLNGEAHVTQESEITLALNQVENTLSVRTDKECQGTYEETIFLSSKILIYPNPVTTSEVTVYLGSNEFREVELALFNVNGRKVYNKMHTPDNGNVSLNFSGMSQGVYILNIKTDNSLLNYKIIKR